MGMFLEYRCCNLKYRKKECPMEDPINCLRCNYSTIEMSGKDFSKLFEGYEEFLANKRKELL